MPEGVEVTLQKESLQKFINGTLEEFNIKSGRYMRHTLPKELKEFQNSLPTKITKIDNKGKLLYIIYKNNWIQIIRLGMTGKFHSSKKKKHDHYEWKTSKGNFYLNDYRNFGTITLTKDKNYLYQKLSSLGLDPLISPIIPEQIKDLINKWCSTKRKNNELALFLMNQKNIAGIGNYLRADIIYKAQLDPFLNICDFSQYRKLANAINYIFTKSYNDQKEGYGYKFLIYKNPLAKHKKIGGRTLWYISEYNHK